MKTSTSIQEHNQNYLTLFNEALRLKRTVDGVNAADDYIVSLPLKNTIIQSAVQNLDSSKVTKVTDAVDKITKQIIRAKPTGVIDFASYGTVSEARVKNVSEKKHFSTNNLPPPGSCGRCGEKHQKGTTCPQIKSVCKYCKTPGHIIQVCRKLYFKNNPKSISSINKPTESISKPTESNEEPSTKPKIPEKNKKTYKAVVKNLNTENEDEDVEIVTFIGKVLSLQTKQRSVYMKSESILRLPYPY